LLPAMRQRLTERDQHRDEKARARATAEGQRTEMVHRLSGLRVELGKLDGDLALAAERLANAEARRLRAVEERAAMEQRAGLAATDQSAAAEHRESAAAEHERILKELSGRAEAEEEVRRRLAEQRATVRRLEQELQGSAQTLKALEGERTALEGELASLRERAGQAAVRRSGLQQELAEAERRRDTAVERAGFLTQESKRASAAAEQARHALAETREHEAMNRAERRQAEEALAQMTARRQALEDLERDRVGLAPGAAALLAARDKFAGGVL